MRLLLQADGGTVPVRVASVADAKAFAEAALGIPAAAQRLVAGGRELTDGAALADCVGLRDGCTVHLLRRAVGGSAAARASAATRRKRERAQLKEVMKDQDSSEEEEGSVEDFPACVEQMPDDLRVLMKFQMEAFTTQLEAAIKDPGPEQEELEALTSDFNKLLYHGFVQNKGFYPLDHKHPSSAAHDAEHRYAGGKGSKRTPVDEEEEGDGQPAPIETMRRLRDNPWFKNFIVCAILVAGINVGINTFLDCGQDADGVDYQSCYSETNSEKLYAETDLPLGANWTQSTCKAARGCYESAVSGDANSTEHCWARGPMPECYTGETAEELERVLESIDFVILLIFTFECVLKIACEGTKPWLFCRDMWNVFDVLIVIACYLPAGGNVAVLRLLRLARLLKLLHAIEDLQVVSTRTPRSPSLSLLPGNISEDMWSPCFTDSFRFNRRVRFDRLHPHPPGACVLSLRDYREHALRCERSG